MTKNVMVISEKEKGTPAHTVVLKVICPKCGAQHEPAYAHYGELNVGGAGRASGSQPCMSCSELIDWEYDMWG